MIQTPVGDARTRSMAVNGRWVAVAEDRWELRNAKGNRLGSLVRFDGPTWAGLPRGGQYLPPQTELRAAAEALLAACRSVLEAAGAGQPGNQA